MRPRLRYLLLPIAALLVAALLLLPGPPAQSVAVDQMYLSFEPIPFSPGVFSTGQAVIPGVCSTWHELFPAYCVIHHEDAYEDNGDGVVSVCDGIVLDGVTWHIAWVGPTYYLSVVTTGDQSAWEPNQGPHDPGNPICETWQEVYPDFGLTSHIDDWFDNDQSGSLTICDEILSGGLVYHIDDIRLNIIVEPPGTPVERSTWGRIKNVLGIGG